MLDVRDLRKSFGGFQAVDGVSLTVPTGSISAIIGPNGAGKTTLFNLITGHVKPDGGRVVFKKRDVTGVPPHDLCRLGMGRSFQRTNIFPRLTVYENIQAAYLSHRGRGWNLFTPVDRLYREESLALLDAVGLLDKAGEVSGFLSHGNQKQIELGIALALEPEILLLDEPTAGMSAQETRESIQLIERIKQRQRPDGGWSQAPDMASDAWATGQALYALAQAGLKADEPTIQRAHAFLIKTQRDDGSWPMTSRPTKPGDKGCKSLIPITGAGSAWAILGLVRSRSGRAPDLMRNETKASID